MPKNNDRTVSLRPDGLWGNQLDDGLNTSSTHATQEQAIEAAMLLIEKSGGGTLTIINGGGKALKVKIEPKH